MGKWLATFIERRPRFILPGLLALVAIVDVLITVAPAIVSLAIAAVLAAAWCRWIEKSAASGPRSVR
jgi:hypothetical protein